MEFETGHRQNALVDGPDVRKRKMALEVSHEPHRRNADFPVGAWSLDIIQAVREGRTGQRLRLHSPGGETRE